MKIIFNESIESYESYIEKNETRIDNIVNNLSKEFKTIDSRLFVQKRKISISKISIEISIENTESFSKVLFIIDDNNKITPIRKRVGYPNTKEVNLDEVYENLQLDNQDNDIDLIKNMFKKYRSYGALFKRIKNELKLEK